MSMLTKAEILDLIQANRLTFTPALDEFQLQAHAIDLRLGSTFLIARRWTFNQQGRIALRSDEVENGIAHFDTIELEAGQVFDLLPGESVLVSTLEVIGMPDDLVGQMFPRSSVNRRGLAVELSGIIDAGYEGNLIIPVRNNDISSVVRLYPGERFCQITLTRLAAPADVRRSRYHRRDIATGVQPEQNADEVQLVRAGKLAELKQRYGVATRKDTP
ncbi:MAG: dCTP deaminase [Ktedonobacterales bacterium]|nr:dCTP deaminase [Ktedonobacterales bacterium]